MAALPLQKHVAHHAVSVQIQLFRVFPVTVHHNTPLQNGGRLRLGPHVKNSVPAVHILLHRLAVEEDYRRLRRHRLINEHGSRRSVHRIDTKHIASQRKETLHLVVLRILVPPGILDIQSYLHALFLLKILGAPFKLPPDIVQKGVVPPVQADADSDGLLFLRPFRPRTAGKQEKRAQPQLTQQDTIFFHTSHFVNPPAG